MLFRSGESALRSHHTMILRGVLRVPDQGIDAPIVECFRAPGDSFTVVDYAGVGRFESGVLDGVVWADDPTGGPRIKAGAERAESVRSADFYRAANWREAYPERLTIGTVLRNGRAVWEVLTVSPEGKRVVHSFDAETHLEVALASTLATEGGPQSAETTFSRWVTFGGVLSPTRISDTTGASSSILDVESIDYDAVDFPTLTLPAGVAELVASP